MIDYVFLHKYQMAWEHCNHKGVMLSRLKTLKKTALTEQDDTDIIRTALVEALASDKQRIQYMQRQKFYIA